jgi:hypothetical protein
VLIIQLIIASLKGGKSFGAFKYLSSLNGFSLSLKGVTSS